MSNGQAHSLKFGAASFVRGSYADSPRRCSQLAVVGLGVVRSTFPGGPLVYDVLCCLFLGTTSAGCRWAQPPAVHVCVEPTDSRP